MENKAAADLRARIRSILSVEAADPLARCLKEQLSIILKALEGWDALGELLAGAG